MDSDKERELRQLWAVASDLFKIASASSFRSSSLSPNDVAGAFETRTPSSGSAERECILLIAHLTDVATRLVTINDMLANKVLSNYRAKLLHENKTDPANAVKNVAAVVKKNPDRFLCHLLRDSPSHLEGEARHQDKHEIRKKVLKSLSIRRVYDAVESARNRLLLQIQAEKIAL